MKKALFIIPPENFRDEELFVPMRILGEAGMELKIASNAAGAVRGMKGGEVMADISLDDAAPASYDAFIVVGGQGTQKHLWNRTKLLQLLKEAHQTGKLVAGICAGSVVLAQAGLLKGLNATTFNSPDFIAELKKYGARYTGEGLEITANIITAGGPPDALKFGNAIVEMFAAVPAAFQTGKKGIHPSVTVPAHDPMNDI